ncbi:translation initiation factor IF-2-like [Schistocerca piceifrons]|uniref:translation initiation factor IF-2-like n=1 Tax=Schistocerca piceifrons TaxID=274613 RepID=UPI001F5F8041|nr:translation initiation factor IF-2-like [Schistocerca piceifrons]
MSCGSSSRARPPRAGPRLLAFTLYCRRSQRSARRGGRWLRASRHWVTSALSAAGPAPQPQVLTAVPATVRERRCGGVKAARCPTGRDYPNLTAEWRPGRNHSGDGGGSARPTRPLMTARGVGGGGLPGGAPWPGRAAGGQPLTDSWRRNSAAMHWRWTGPTRLTPPRPPHTVYAMRVRLIWRKLPASAKGVGRAAAPVGASQPHHTTPRLTSRCVPASQPASQPASPSACSSPASSGPRQQPAVFPASSQQRSPPAASSGPRQQPAVVPASSLQWSPPAPVPASSQQSAASSQQPAVVPAAPTTTTTTTATATTTATSSSGGIPSGQPAGSPPHQRQQSGASAPNLFYSHHHCHHIHLPLCRCYH